MMEKKLLRPANNPIRNNKEVRRNFNQGNYAQIERSNQRQRGQTIARD